MPMPDDLRSEEMKRVFCGHCGTYLRSLVPKGINGIFYHPECMDEKHLKDETNTLQGRKVEAKPSPPRR
jgi:hypothetical protein